MSGLLGTLNTAVKGLNAQQAAIATASNNISNANTEGYSRQRVELAEDAGYHYPGVGRLGSGVKIEGVRRQTDEFVDYQIRKENSLLNKYTEKNGIASQIETIFNESDDTGINFSMGEMFNAWQNLSDNPESLSAKSVVVENSKTFASTVNQMAKQLDSLKGDTVLNIRQNNFEINTIANQLIELNGQIANISLKSDSPNDLLDKRDLLLKNLSGLAEYTESFDSLGRVSVNLAGKEITSKDATYRLSTVTGMSENEDGTVSLTIAVGGDPSEMKNISVSAETAKDMGAGSLVYYDSSNPSGIKIADVGSGKIGGEKEALNEIAERIQELNSFVAGIADEVNKLHNPDGSGIDFFTFDGGKNAANFNVSMEIQNDNGKVATGENSGSASGDASRALAIANLRNAKINGANTFEEIYSSIVTKTGVSVQYSANMANNQEALMNQLENRRDSISGVSIDEEVTNIIQYQRIYEANSRVISTISEMLDTLINRTGA